LNKSIYLDFDTIFDTRLGTLIKYDKKVSDSIMKDHSLYYDNRIYDEFLHINNRLFNKLYSNRDSEILSLSPLSNILKVVANEINLTTIKKLDRQETITLNLTINVYPYKLEDEFLETLRKYLIVYIGDANIDIEYIYIEDKDMTLKYVSDNFDIMFKYDFISWLDYQILSSNYNAPEVLLYIPALSMNPIVSKAETIESVFESLCNMYKYYINIEVLEIKKYNRV